MTAAKKCLSATALVTAVCVAFPAYAQDSASEVDSLRAEVAALKAQLAAIAAKVDAVEKKSVAEVKWKGGPRNKWPRWLDL